MADDSSKPTKDVHVGDRVMATDPETGETRAETVTAEILGNGEKLLVDITVETDDGDREVITATGGHPFWVPELDAWTDAEELRPGQWLRTSAGTHVQITALTHRTSTATVHNLTVNNLHTYYVLAGAAPVLVHNCGDVYRSDTRDPGEIFDKGFAPKGDNMNLEEHVAGVSGVYTPDSGFVSTTTSKSHALSRKGHTYVIDRRGVSGGIDVNKRRRGRDSCSAYHRFVSHTWMLARNNKKMDPESELSGVRHGVDSNTSCGKGVFDRSSVVRDP